MTDLERAIHHAVYDLTARLVYLFGKLTVRDLERLAGRPKVGKGQKR